MRKNFTTRLLFISVCFLLSSAVTYGQEKSKTTAVTGNLIRVTPKLADIDNTTMYGEPLVTTRDANGIIMKSKELKETEEKLTKELKDRILRQYNEAIKNNKTADGNVQQQSPSSPNVPGTSLGVNINGLTSPGLQPTDNNMAAGPNHLIQIVNNTQGSQYRIFDKAGATLATGILAALTGRSGSGDPIVLYDQLANRWFMAEFGPSACCTELIIAVSTTANPTGTWNIYSYVDASFFPDYPKFSVWHNAYYAYTNDFNTAGTAFLGTSVWAFDRAAMIAGAPTAQMVRQRLNFTNVFAMGTVGLEGMTPSTQNGLFVIPTSATSLSIFEVTPNFTTPSITVGPLTALPVNAWSSSGNIAQQTGPTLGSLSPRLMFKVSYRNNGGTESIVAAHTINNGGLGQVRWYELRRVASTWTTFQQGNIAGTDGNSRWMPGISMDGCGNIAVMYDVAGSGTPAAHPSIRYTGRNASDPLNTMTLPESVIINAASGSGSITRWGDYNTTVQDYSAAGTPNNGSFWSTSQYANQQTRVANFTLTGGCAAPTASDLSITKTDGVTSYTPGGSTTYTIVASNAGPDAVTGATVADVFPAAIIAVNWTAAYAGGATGPASGTGNINASVNLPTGGSATFTAVCTISGSASGNLVNTATVTSPPTNIDPTPGNNSATDTDTQNPPVNDLCTDALPIACGQTLAGTTVGATLDVVPTCVTPLSTAPGVWYTVVGDGTPNTLSLCGSGYDTKIGVFTGTCGALVCVTGNDDFCGTRSQVTFNTTLGTTYRVIVTGFSTNTGAFTLTRICCAPPTISCPANITVNNTAGVCGAVVTYPMATVTGTPTPTVTYSHPSGTVFPIGTTTVTATATNLCGTVSCTFTITVVDNEPPTITCPANIVVSNDPGICGAVVTFAPIATDNCPIGTTTPATINQSSSNTGAAGSVACNTGGIHTDNSYWRAYNLAPLNLVGPFTITRVRFGVEQATGTGGTQPVNVRIYTQSGAAFPGGTRTLVRTQTFAVPNQNGTIFSANLSVPVTVPANAIVILELNTPAGTGNSFFIGSNAAPETGPSYLSAAACGITIPTTTAGIGFPNMHIILFAEGTVPVPGSGTVSVPASGSVFPVGTTTVTSTATDGAGNTATCTFTVTVNDTQAPTITCPANIVRNTDANACVATIAVPNPTTADNCAVTQVTWAMTGATIASSPATGINYIGTRAFSLNGTTGTGVTTITYTVKDAAGNMSTCSFTVTVNDGQLPVITTPPANRTVCEGSSATFSVAAITAPTAGGPLTYQWQIWNPTTSTWSNVTGNTSATTSTLTLSNVTQSMNTNSYRCVVTGRCSVVTSGFATLYVNPLPIVNLTTSIPPNLLPTQVLTITATVSPAGGTYVWRKNGVAIPGATGNTLSGLTVDDAGTYSVVYTDLNGCVSISSNIVVTAQPSENLYVYPVPNRGVFNVRFYNQTGEAVTVRVFDAKGSEVYQKKSSTTLPYTTINVDMTTRGILAAGVYVVEVRGADARLIGTKKVIVHNN